MKETKDIFESKEFLTRLDIHLRALIHKRFKRGVPEVGLKYRRDWYDKLESIDGLSAKWLSSELGKILKKESNLSKDLREIVKAICLPPFSEYLQSIKGE